MHGFKKDVDKFASKESVDLTLNNVYLNRTTLPPITTPAPNTNISDPIFYANCANSSFGCLAVPEGCTADYSCNLGATWLGLSPSSYALHLFTISGEYVALGFPQSAAMSPAPVFVCDNQPKASVSITVFSLNFNFHAGVLEQPYT